MQYIKLQRHRLLKVRIFAVAFHIVIAKLLNILHGTWNYSQIRFLTGSEQFHVSTPPTYVPQQPPAQPGNQGPLRTLPSAVPPNQPSTPPNSDIKVQQMPQQPTLSIVSFAIWTEIWGNVPNFAVLNRYFIDCKLQIRYFLLEHKTITLSFYQLLIVQ